MEKKSKRIQVLIYPQFQLRLIFGLVASNLVLVGVFFLTQVLFFNYYKKMGQEMKLPADHMFFSFVDQQQHQMLLFFLIAAVLVMIAGAVYSMVMSHRVAGPVVRVIRYLNEFKKGKSRSELKFREQDFFGELADSVNQFVARHGSK
jgi:methyl-accepting chemotaxis protein